MLDWLGYPTFPNETAVNKILESASQKFKDSFEFNALPLMCYHKVVRDWFTNNNIKDDSLTDAYVPPAVSGHLSAIRGLNSISGLTDLAYVNYGLDYFTSALPYLQRGDAIMLNGANNEVTFDRSKSNQTNVLYAGTTQNNPSGEQMEIGANYPAGSPNAALQTPLNANLLIDNSSSLSVQLGTTIQELRFANALQEWAEKSLRVGTRYVDFCVLSLVLKAVTALFKEVSTSVHPFTMLLKSILTKQAVRTLQMKILHLKVLSLPNF